MARWETLFLVAFSGKGLPQTELARLIGVQGPTMVAMLNQLAQEGLISRYQSETDQRVTVNEITPAGLAAITDIMGITNVLRNELLAEIPREQQELCIDVLDAILNKLDRMR
nr:MarR family transcriptional regulator [Sphingobium xanthum]